MLLYILFAYQESTRFSPFNLVIGQWVRGPLDLVRDAWEGSVEFEDELVTDYVQRL